LPLIGPDTLFVQIRIPIPQACFLPTLVEIGLVVLEKKLFKGKVDSGWTTNRDMDGGLTERRTTDAMPWHKLWWPSARWAKNHNGL